MNDPGIRTKDSAPVLSDFDSANGPPLVQDWDAGVVYGITSGGNIYPISPFISVLTFGAKGDGITNDTAAIQAAVNALLPNQELIFPGGSYAINGVIIVNTAGVSIHFDGCRLLIGDTGTAGTITNTASGKMGLLFQSADGISVTGAVRCIGQGTPTTTTLAGMVFDSCDNLQVPCAMYFENMAAGRFVFWCDRSVFGDVTGKDMYGQQTFGGGSAGTVEVVIGCRYSKFGDAIGFDNYKPVRYLSVAVDAASASINNTNCTFGASIGESAAAVTEASAITIRSAVDCSFGMVSSTGMAVGALINQHLGDDNFSVNRIYIDAVTGTYPSTGASVDAPVRMDTASAVALGKTTIGVVNVTAAGEFGVYVASGDLTILNADIDGGARSVVGLNCNLNFGRLRVTNAATRPVSIGRSCDFSADFIDIQTGTSGATTYQIGYDTAFGSGSLGKVSIGAVRFNFNSIGNDATYVVADTTNGFESWSIQDVNGTGTTGQCRFAADNFIINNHKVSSTQVPTAGTYSVGTLLWKSDVAAAGIPGWLCTTAGTPGTWKAMAAVAP